VTTLALAAKGLLAAYAARHAGATAPAAGISLAFSWTLVEGAWTSPFLGTNNYGSVHATQGFAAKHSADAGYGMVAFLDVAITRMRVYPSLVLGGSDFLGFIEGSTSLGSVSSPADFASDLYCAGYYQGPHPQSGEPAVTPVSQRKAARAAGTLNASDTANIAYGTLACSNNWPRAQKAIADAASEAGDPSAVTVGPPFAPLSSRLWPDGKSHTLDDAIAHVGPSARKAPAGYVSIDECLSTPNHDGVWMFGPVVAQPQLPAPTTQPTTPASSPAAPSSSGATIAVAVLGLTIAAGALGAAAATPARRRAAA
jgi:hypothetical protein